MAIITREHVKQHLADVTPEQIGKCLPIIGPDHKTTYFVENEHRKRGSDERLIEYQVRYDDEHGFTCTCPSGQDGFAHVRHPSGVCKHCRWITALIVEQEEYNALIEQQEEERRRQEYGDPMTPEPAWYDPTNTTSYYHGTRALLALDENTGKEVDDARYALVTTPYHREMAYTNKCFDEEYQDQ